VGANGVILRVAGIEVDDEARTIIGQGKELKKDSRPRKEDIVQE